MIQIGQMHSALEQVIHYSGLNIKGRRRAEGGRERLELGKSCLCRCLEMQVERKKQ